MNRIAKVAMKMQCLIRHVLQRSSREAVQRLEQVLDELLYQVYLEMKQNDQEEG